MATGSFRLRSHRAGPLVLVDEAVAVIESDPLRWLVRGLLPSVPVAVLALLFIHLHRVVWIDDPWTGWVPLLSAAASGALVVALQVRAVGQGFLAREVVAALHPVALAEAPHAGARGALLPLAATGAIVWAAVALGLALFVLPGIALAGLLLPLTAIIAVEGRDVGAAFTRARGLPRGTTAKGALSGLLYVALALLVWLDVLLGTQVGIWLLRMLTGADVTVLSRTLGFGNEAFVLGSLIIALLLLDPLWAIHKALLYLEARLGQTGSDLRERWRQLPDRRGPSGGDAGEKRDDGRAAGAGEDRDDGHAAGGAGGDRNEAREAAPPSPGAARLASAAQAGLVLVAAALTAVFPPGAAYAFEQSMDEYADDLEGYKAHLDSVIGSYKASGYEDLSGVQTTLRVGTSRSLVLPDGSAVPFDGSALADQLPDAIHTDDTAERALRVSRRLGEAIALMRGEAPPEPLSATDARALLEAELGDGTYEVPAEDDAGDEYRSDLQDRFRTWWEAVVRKLTWNPPPQQNQGSRRPLFPAFSGKWIIAGVAVLLAVLLAVFLLAQGGHIRVGVPLGDGAGGPGAAALPDARQRTPLGWREHADRLAAEGFLREAVRAQFLAVLARLDRTREIDYRPERTNGEHLRTFAGSEVRLDAFVSATGLFEEAWYGDVLLARPDYDRMSRACDILVQRGVVGDPSARGAVEGSP